LFVDGNYREVLLRSFLILKRSLESFFGVYF